MPQDPWSDNIERPSGGSPFRQLLFAPQLGMVSQPSPCFQFFTTLPASPHDTPIRNLHARQISGTLTRYRLESEEEERRCAWQEQVADGAASVVVS